MSFTQTLLFHVFRLVDRVAILILFAECIHNNYENVGVTIHCLPQPPGRQDHLPQHGGVQTGGAGSQQREWKLAEDCEPDVVDSSCHNNLENADGVNMEFLSSISATRVRDSVSQRCVGGGRDRDATDSG